MSPSPNGMTLVFATRNSHKANEIRAILGGSVACRTLADFPGTPDVVEDAPTFAGNATKKAVALARWLSHSPSSAIAPPATNWFVLADDSGLEVDALGGAPGVHSARFAALDSGLRGNSPDADNNAKLLRLLAEFPAEKRTARFRCVLALVPVAMPKREAASPVCYADELELQTELFEGSCEGRIGFTPRGANGFGYDPLFTPEGLEQTFAELGDASKNRISHRSHALAKLRRWLETRQFV